MIKKLIENKAVRVLWWSIQFVITMILIGISFNWMNEKSDFYAISGFLLLTSIVGYYGNKIVKIIEQQIQKQKEKRNENK